MAKLIHKNKITLSDMKYVIGSLGIAKGLMFASRNKITKGMCLVTPGKKDKKFEASITMLFCFYPCEIIFVNSKFIVVEKTILKPWKLNYTPEKPCKYVIESRPGTFKKVKIGEMIKIVK